MRFDFDSPVERRSTYSVKWNIPEGELPMWVADMDFKVAPNIAERLKKRLDNGVFGYTDIPPQWADAYMNWWRDRHGLKIERESLIHTTGVIPGLAMAIKKFTTEGEKVLIQSPVYNVFFNIVNNNGRRLVESPLIYRNGEYEMDLEDLEEKLKDPAVTMMMLCNPHNPVGKIWDRETLGKVGELCRKYGVLVVSDEIHCDITEPGKDYVPFASVSETNAENSVTLIAPTKCFNIAGIHTAAAMVPNPLIRNRMKRAIWDGEVAEAGAFAIDVVIGAFEESGDWLDEMREYVSANKKLVREQIAAEIPEIHVVPSEATYLLWLDCGKLTDNSRELSQFLRKEAKLFLSDGVQYGESGRTFLRMNVACPRSYVEDGLDRLAEGISKWKQRG